MLMDIYKIDGEKHYVYMLRCNDNTIYTGYAKNPYKRYEVHSLGKGAKYTRARLPLKLVYIEEFDSKSEALKREYEIKTFSKLKKEELINDVNNKI